MNLLLIAPEIKNRAQIRNYSDVWSWYLSKEFQRRGIGIRFDCPLYDKRMSVREVIEHYERLDLTGIDHIVALGTRYFERVPWACGRVLMQRCRGAVTHVHDSGRRSVRCHCTFTVRSDRVGPNDYYVGWAADHDLCRPSQAPGELRILVDHADYGPGRVDHSERVSEECIAFAKSGLWRGHYDTVRLRRIVDGGVEDFGTGEVRPYLRRSIPFEAIAQEYSKTHVFMVTHPESVGLSVLETAMAGALPVAPDGFIQADRLATVRHLTYKSEVLWQEVLDAIDIKASRQMAIAQNRWKDVAARMLFYFKRFEQTERKGARSGIGDVPCELLL